MPWFHTSFTISSWCWDSCGYVSCCTTSGRADALCHIRGEPRLSPSSPSANAPMSPNRLQDWPKSLIVPCVSKRRGIPSHLLRCHPTPCPRRTDDRVSLTPRGTAVLMPMVRIEAGWGEAICVPMAIPVVVHGASCTAPGVADIFWRLMCNGLQLQAVTGSRAR